MEVGNGENLYEIMALVVRSFAALLGFHSFAALRELRFTAIG